MKITADYLRQLIKEETQGEMEFAELEAARQAYLEEPNDETKHELGLMINQLVEPLMAEMGLFWEAEAYYNRGDLVFNNRSVDITIDPRGAMGRYDVNVSAQVSAPDTDPAFEPIDITIPSMKGVLQFVNDKVFSSSGMVGEPEAQTELPLEHKMRITKSQLQKVIKEAIKEELNELGDPRSPSPMSWEHEGAADDFRTQVMNLVLDLAPLTLEPKTANAVVIEVRDVLNALGIGTDTQSRYK